MSPKAIRIALAIFIGAGIGFLITLFLPGEGESPLPIARHTPHLEIRTDVEGEELDHHVRVFEEFFRVFSERYYPVTQKFPLRMALFATTEGYRKWVDKFYPGTDTPYGFYQSNQNIIVVNLSSGLGTATHELVHHFRWVSFARRPPPWVDEGFASFFEKFMGYLDEDGKLHISFGYFSNWRFPETRARVNSLRIRQLVNWTPADQGVARSVMLYLHRQGLLEKFIRRARAGCRSDCLDELAEVTGKDLTTFEREWKAWIAAQTDRRDVGMVPRSFVVTPERWQNFLKTNSDRIVWSEEKKRFVPKT
jgi:hypothetical protein